MKTRFVFSVTMLAVCMACEDDPVTPPPPSAYEDLTQRGHVLNNLEVAYNRRQVNKYEEVLDQNFTFFFYGGDVGGDIPAQWGRVDDLTAHTNMFDAAYVDTDPSDGISPAVTKIAMDVKWEDGVQWQAIPQGDEDWYRTTVFYTFQFDMGENYHRINNPGSKAQFTVRNAGTDEAPRWQLVEMRDLDQDLRTASSAATEQSTWGSVKAMYR